MHMLYYNPWNNLPHNTVEFSSLSKFKRCMIRAALSKYLLYCLCMLLCNYTTACKDNMTGKDRMAPVEHSQLT